MACTSNCYGCSKQTALSSLPAWLVPLPGWSQAEFLIWPLCSRRKALLHQPHRKNKTLSYESGAVEWSSKGTRSWCLQEGQGKQAEVCSPCCARHSLSHNAATARAPAVSPGEGAALPPLPGGQSPTCFVPRGGGTGLTSSPLPFPAQGSMRTSQQFPAGGRVWLGTWVPTRDGLSWVSCVTFAHKWWLSTRASGQGAGWVGARKGSPELITEEQTARLVLTSR